MFEFNLKNEWADAVRQRSSVRQYLSGPDDAQLSQLGELCRKISWQGVVVRMFRGPGLRSAIKGTNVYAVIIGKEGVPQELEGYVGEALVLEATNMGLGTCWLGAGFYPDIVSRNVNLQTKEAVHCVISLGKANLPTPNPKRKPLEKLCGKTDADLEALGVWQKEAVNLARLAPSAMNQQPWKISVDKTSLAVQESPVIIKKYANIDRGICMLHAAVGAASKGHTPEWKKIEDGYIMRA